MEVQLSDNLKIAEAESISRIAQKHTDIILSELKDANCEHILPVSTDVESCTLKENVSPQSSSIILDSASDKSDSLFAWAKTDSKTNKDVSLSNSFQDYKISGSEYAPSDSSSSSSESSVDSNADIEKEFSTNVLSYLRNSKVATRAKKNLNILQHGQTDTSVLSDVSNNIEIYNHSLTSQVRLHYNYIFT
ncbi:hypothetical protein RN001_001620 [Aquatica leii]|uniref:Uncharacterized protein n=1 Tax=Aquatica leii TaxID=1421715 RepID=A0AAN7Q4B8_9COLE|nr:hypothetical protein RN001_001620 [Aquatica leii]